jgi:hypothetical protein
MKKSAMTGDSGEPIATPSVCIALMMEAARTSETLVNFYQTTRCYNPEDSNLQVVILCLPEALIQYKLHTF